MSLIKLCLATGNVNKVREIGALLDKNFELLSLKDIGFTGELAEDYFTIEENSQQKAEYIYKNFDINCFADDTGLEVYSLNNEPGVKSARYAGEHKSDEDNIALLLQNLKGSSDRQARFKTVITLFINDVMHQFEGVIEGKIIESPKGKSGFGYDPVFIPAGYEKTFAEMSLEVKNKISHRALAFKKLVDFINNYII